MSEYKDIFGLTVVPMAILCGTIACCLSRRLRSLFFLAFVVLAITTERMSVNFVSRDWYRGTCRGYEFAVSDVVALSLFFSLLLRPQAGQRRWYWPASLGVMLLYFCYCAFSVAISDPQLWGLFELSKMLRGMVVFLVGALFVRTERDLRLLVLGLAVVVCWQGGQSLYQRYHDGIHRVIGYIGDPNSLSMYLCLVMPVFVAAVTSDFPKYVKYASSLAMLLGGVAMMMTISRAGVAAMGVVMLGATAACVSFKLSAKKVAISLLALALTAGVLGKSWHQLAARYGEVTLEEEYQGKGQGRGYYLRLARAIVADRWFGVGLNNWSYLVTNQYGPEQGWNFVPYIGTEQWPSDKVPPGRNLDAAQAAPAHNLGALTLGELGVPGLLVFALLWLRWFQMGASFLWPRLSDPLHRMGVGFFFSLCGIFLQSLTEWVYRQTPIYFTFNIMVGALASLYWIKRQQKSEEAGEWVEVDQYVPENT